MPRKCRHVLYPIEFLRIFGYVLCIYLTSVTFATWESSEWREYVARKRDSQVFTTEALSLPRYGCAREH